MNTVLTGSDLVPTPSTFGLVIVRRVMVLLSLALLVITLTGCSQSRQPLQLDDAWVRLSPPNSPMTAGYGTFKNTARQPITLGSMTSPQFASVSLHNTEDINGKATMREVHNHTLAPGETLTLKPGGFHLMLMQRTADTPEGSHVSVTFELKSSASVTHTFEVIRR